MDKRTSFKKVAFGMASVVALSAMLTSSVMAADYTMKVGAVSAPSTPTVRALYEVFKPRVEELTNGVVEVDIYENGTLGEEPQMVEQTQLGTIQMVQVGSNLSNVYPVVEMLNLPYIFKSNEEADKVLRTEFADEILKDLESVGLHGLGFFDNGFREVTTTAKPLNSLADFNGLKIRTPNSTGQINLFTALGANPTVVAFSELYSALQQGVVDGQENGYNTIVSQCYYEVQKYVAVTNHMYGWFCNAVNQAWWESLPEDCKEAINTAFKEAQDFEFELSRSEAEANLQVLIDNGMEVTEPDLAELEEACVSVYDDFRENFPQYVDLLDQLLAQKAN